jgi:hypothetical protein
MIFSKPETASVVEMLLEIWPMILLYAVVLGIGIVAVVRRPTAPTFSLSNRAVRNRTRDASTGQENG